MTEWDAIEQIMANASERPWRIEGETLMSGDEAVCQFFLPIKDPETGTYSIKALRGSANKNCVERMRANLNLVLALANHAHWMIEDAKVAAALRAGDSDEGPR
jgi:hypothetical protein